MLESVNFSMFKLAFKVEVRIHPLSHIGFASPQLFPLLHSGSKLIRHTNSNYKRGGAAVFERINLIDGVEIRKESSLISQMLNQKHVLILIQCFQKH